MLMIVVEDQFGQQSPAIGLVFPFIQTSPENPSYLLPAPEVTLNTEKLEGNAFQQAKIIVTANGQEYVTYANESGFWSMDNPIQNGGFATIVAEDSRGVQSPEISIAKLFLANLNHLLNLQRFYWQVMSKVKTKMTVKLSRFNL
ncbi:hypothetical protein ABD624_13385 [Avibacterium paragallinarum]